MKKILSIRSYTLKDQLRFGRLSGDFNPLHTDPVKARREIYGGVIAHGANAVLCALEAYAARIRQEGTASLAISNLGVSYPNPIYLNRKITTYLAEERAGFARLETWDREFQTKVLEMQFEWVPDAAGSGDAIPEGKTSGPLRPGRYTIEQLKNKAGRIPLYLDRTGFAEDFPVLSKILPGATAGGILAISRLAGMECPGAQSVCSSFKVDFSRTDRPIDFLDYRVIFADPRFSLVRMSLESRWMSGTFDTFYRPMPVAQDSFEEVGRKVDADEFRNISALIIGGSRGLGEAVAKIIASGGGETVVTYNAGKEDADRVVAEITSARRICRTFRLDVSNPAKSISEIAEGGILPTHIFYFPTPKMRIFKQQPFCRSVFNAFGAYYAAGLEKLYRAVRRAWPERVLSLFYPSTRCIDEPSEGCLEFAAAKAAGETLCLALERTDNNLSVYIARLPWLATDRTLAFTARPAASASGVMLEIVRRMNAARPETKSETKYI